MSLEENLQVQVQMEEHIEGMLNKYGMRSSKSQ